MQIENNIKTLRDILVSQKKFAKAIMYYVRKIKRDDSLI